MLESLTEGKAVMGKLVLVIDDSKTIQSIMEICLSRAGYEVLSHADGIAAVEWLESAGARIPDLVFVDIGLPKWDGYGVIRYFRAQPVFSQTPFVIITRHNGTIDRLKGRLVGAAAYLTKPFQTAEIVSVVQSHLGRAPV
jgi:DNA-binding response OmpR family regulator